MTKMTKTTEMTKNDKIEKNDQKTKFIKKSQKLMSTKNNLLTSRTAERHARGQKMLKLSVVEVYDFLTYGKWKWQPQNQIFLIKCQSN